MFVSRQQIRVNAAAPPTTTCERYRQLAVKQRGLATFKKENEVIWIPGTIMKKFGKLYYLVQLDIGYTLKRRIDQLKPTAVQRNIVREEKNP